jgi:hypothetical protein
MAELKTKENAGNVENFLNSIEDPKKREDSFRILEIMEEVTGAPAKMWGETIVGFGNYHYKYASGREGDWFLTGFSPRKQNLTLYLNSGFKENNPYLSELGTFKTGKGCLYLKKLDDVEASVLRKMIRFAIESLKNSST